MLSLSPSQGSLQRDHLARQARVAQRARVALGVQRQIPAPDNATGELLGVGHEVGHLHPARKLHQITPVALGGAGGELGVEPGRPDAQDRQVEWVGDHITRVGNMVEGGHVGLIGQQRGEVHGDRGQIGEWSSGG